MANITILKPLDQPIGDLRMINLLKECLRSDDFKHFKMIMAFAKLSPLLKMHDEICSWMRKGNSIEAIVGIDHKGTSQQALQYMLNEFNSCSILFPGRSSTFHPKIYLFYGDERATCFIGSHNLTVGGTELNFESGVRVDMSIDVDTAEFQQAYDCWESLLGYVTPLTTELLSQLIENGLLIDESDRARTGAKERRVVAEYERPHILHSLRITPPLPLPNPKGLRSPRRLSVGYPYRAKALVIQIIPHDNGEIFLSKAALDQQPGFFEYPFSGFTVPKKETNPTYPQRVPDPICRILVINDNEEIVFDLRDFHLNMVLYEKKSEVRITFPPPVARQIPEYSILVMKRTESGYDYEIEVYFPGSKTYNEYLACCNQLLPSGGRPRRRQMGWL